MFIGFPTAIPLEKVMPGVILAWKCQKCIYFYNHPKKYFEIEIIPLAFSFYYLDTYKREYISICGTVSQMEGRVSCGMEKALGETSKR